MGANSADAATRRRGRIGAKAEREVASILAEAGGGVAVRHDLFIPGSKANIDHVVVSGRTVYLIETKAFKPGWYFTLAGRTWRNFRPFVVANVDGSKAYPADKHTLPMARDRLLKQLPAGTRVESIMVVLPSSAKGTVHLRWMRPKQAVAFTGSKLRRWVRRRRKPADDDALAVIDRFVRSR